MGFRFRKSVNVGPFRLNASKTGLGWSVGVPGARYTKMANGRKRITGCLPGTGMSWVEETKKTPVKHTNQSKTKKEIKGWNAFWVITWEILKGLFWLTLIALGVCLIIFLPAILAAGAKGAK